MLLKLSKSEILALRLLCRQDTTVGGLASQLKAKNSFASRIANSLEGKGLITIEKQRTTKTIRLSPASHAQDFKKLSDSRPDAGIEEWLSGMAIGAMIIIYGGAGHGAGMKLLLEEAGCSRATLYKILNRLGAAGIIAKESGTVRISDIFASSFSESYANNIQLIIQRGAKGMNASIRVRKHVVFRTDAKEVPAFFSKTGINALAEKGLEANVTSYRDFYFSLDMKARKIGQEECLIHAMLLAALPQHADMPVLGIFFAKNKNKLNMQLLKKLAKTYSVEAELDELRQKSEFYDKMRGI